MAALRLVAALAFGPLLADTSGTGAAPFYTAESIANSAANVTALFAPNTFVTIYGVDLANNIVAIGPDDIRGGILPTVLIGSGVRVLVNQISANLYYVSPTQVNFLIPTLLAPGPAVVQLTIDGRAGPPITIALEATAPSLFQTDVRTILATHGNGSVATHDAPARRGEIITLWATGLGPTIPPAISNQIPQAAAPLQRSADFRVLLNGVAAPPESLRYAGVAPGFAGLFQINFRIPDDAPSDPEIRISTGSISSPAGRFLPLQ
ncbi:MAG TPA: hypothetical protein VGP79_14805 [Bryobacteraceae bacterium]|nr:hypothetical protein [Bryobacteraceae bacterium]